ncbi:SLC13 family permease [Desulfomonile tiedjei]|uniref:Na+/H+ antiporter NhaD-like permease n=1 Tax=Desulfomonile tiedjei (strain ATCC 49306 / DSM 6799 / DCB-1) TaxID=706587 RepID=I4CB70_DESTA|nr:ArsB/NhaD family transporter [Desulfomonile tiedjei]AFM26811.1 Na+/H+ antiporter NhaD-like permease [Desulfomonile tiedjei DSM 6799]
MNIAGLLIGVILSVVFVFSGTASASGSPSNNAILVIQGQVLDSAGNPVSDAHVQPFRDGHPVKFEGDGSGHKKVFTGRNGLFMLEIPSSAEALKEAKWTAKVTCPSFRPSQIIPLNLHEQDIENGAQRFLGSFTVTLQRYQGAAFWIALVVFTLVYVLIAFEVMHRTLAAFLGATLILLITHTLGTFDDAYKILTYEQALLKIDWNVVFLLMGMMIIVGVLKISGVFQWLAYKSFQLAGGRIYLLSAILCVVTAIASAFLDNVTTMLLLTPVTLEIALVLKVSPFVFLMPEIVASNFGGTATLIGDPPNIMVGSYAGLTFNDFVVNLTPVVIVIMVLQILYNKFLYGKEYSRARVEDVPNMMAFLKEKYPITDSRVLVVGGTVLAGVVLLFILHGFFHMEVSVAALFGAALIVLLNKADVIEVLEKEIEWPSLVFFIMLFIVVGGAEQTGILQAVADWILNVSQGNLVIAILIILWVAGIASAIVDNIPFTATMLPIAAFLTKTIPGAESGVLWWALALGACFGGNGTIIGASANVVTTGIAERAGHKISFYDYFKQAGPITIVSLILSSAYLLLFY